MALTPLPSSIGQGSNPQPSDREPSALPLDHSFRFSAFIFGQKKTGEKATFKILAKLTTVVG